MVKTMVELDDSNMAVEVGNSPYIASADAPPEGALGYSRHYAKKIRDLGKSSRQTWIQTLVQHVLNAPSQRGRGKRQPRDQDGKISNRGRRGEGSVTLTFSGGGGTEAGKVKDSPYLPPIKLTGNPRSLQQIQYSHGRESARGGGGRDTSSQNSRDGSGRESGSQHIRDGSHRRDPDPQSATNNRKGGHHYPPIRSAPAKDIKVKEIPTELANSPYVSNRQNFKVVPLEKILIRNPVKPTHYYHLTNSSGHHSHPNPHPQLHTHSHPSSHHQHPSHHYQSPPQYNHSQQHHHHNLSQHHNHYNNTLYRRPDGQGGFKPSHPYLSMTPRREAWRPPPVVCTQESVNLEKKAKYLASKAIKESKIFTCEGPYPVDAYVRFSLRKRGWVEKFAPKVLSGTSANRTTSSKLECQLDEDFDVICDRNIPAPWEEDNGLYALTSRMVRHRPARFIWGGRGVNSMVIHQEVIVNHFPKARSFSSKTGITNSLRELPWLAGSDPLEFFPRCFLLTEEEREEFIDDFRLTACIAMLKWVLSLFVSDDTSDNSPERSRTIQIIHEEEPVTTSASLIGQVKHSPDVATVEGQDLSQTEAEGKDGETTEDGQSEEKHQSDETNEIDANKIYNEDTNDSEANKVRSGDLEDDLDPDADDPDFRTASDDESDSDSDHSVRLPPNVKGSKREGISMLPDLPIDGASFIEKVRPDIRYQERTGGEVPTKSVDWALSQCERYIQFKLHEDLDHKVKPSLTSNQWEQFLKWYYKVAHDGATVSVTQSKVQKVKETLKKMKKLWPQYDIDGMRNLWIIKPGGKSKGIGIEFCNNLDDIMKYMSNSSIASNYVIQKYIETPLLLYNTKFDIRQWFVVTDWNPLTVWFYKESYLRICSQEFSWDTMHESVHLSNVAIQQFYVNGERSSQLPDDNYMSSERFVDYLADVGHPEAWDKIIYPGMKSAVVNTLLATMDVTEHRKAAFELYGADFMLSASFTPWLLEINSSPGMAPSSKEKAKLCANVVEDLMKVVLDRRESKSCDTGGFEMVFRDSPMPAFKCIDNRMFIEGNRIKRADLQRYASLDHIIKSGDDPSKTDFMKDKQRLVCPRPPPSRESMGKPSTARPDTTNNNKTRSETTTNNNKIRPETTKPIRESVARGAARAGDVKIEPITRSLTKIYGRALTREAPKRISHPQYGRLEDQKRKEAKTAKRYERQENKSGSSQTGSAGSKVKAERSERDGTTGGENGHENNAETSGEENDYDDDDYDDDDPPTEREGNSAGDDASDDDVKEVCDDSDGSDSDSPNDKDTRKNDQGMKSVPAGEKFGPVDSDGESDERGREGGE